MYDKTMSSLSCARESLRTSSTPYGSLTVPESLAATVTVVEFAGAADVTVGCGVGAAVGSWARAAKLNRVKNVPAKESARKMVVFINLLRFSCTKVAAKFSPVKCLTLS